MYFCEYCDFRNFGADVDREISFLKDSIFPFQCERASDCIKHLSNYSALKLSGNSLASIAGRCGKF